jgi:hypothetical protein
MTFDERRRKANTIFFLIARKAEVQRGALKNNGRILKKE